MLLLPYFIFYYLVAKFQHEDIKFMTLALESKMLAATDWAFEKAISNVPVLGSAEKLANDYLHNNKTAEKAANSLIHWQMAKTGSTGFITNLGGIAALPVAIPADISCMLFHQMRMVAAIACLAGINDLHNDKVKIMCIGCLAGDAIRKPLIEAGIQAGKAATLTLIKQIPGRALAEINKAVGVRLVTKFGSTGIFNLGKAVPLVGGVIGGSMNSIFTYGVGKTAKYIFFG